jgi:hypothetical protein
MRLALILLALTARSATLVGRIVDAETGETIPATVAIRASDGSIVADHPSFRGGFRSAGTFEKQIGAGETVVTVSRGFDYIPVTQHFVLGADERKSLTFSLRRRSPLRREGWISGDNHDHMIHGERNIVVDFPYIALAARAEGLDYLAVAQDWNLPRVSADELARITAQSSAPDLHLTWNLEAPKNYWLGDASRCLGHGWTVGMRGQTHDGRDAAAELLELSAMDYQSAKPIVPNFEIQALIHSLGGIVAYSHPARWWRGKWGGQGGYPVEEDKFISNMAVELPFDTLAGPTYDAIDILMPPEEKAANANALKLWFLLLDHGYHIAASGSSDATFDRPGGGVPGKVRMYTHLDGPVEMGRVAAAIKTAHSFVTTGPLVTLEIDGRSMGETITLPAPKMEGRVRAWADRITRVELIRNGEVFQSFPNADGKSEFTGAFRVEESGRAWYIARVYGADEMQVAITNPIWFEPRGSQAPPPVRAQVSATIVDAASGKPLDGDCVILRMDGREAIEESRVAFRGGRLTVDPPPTARLRVEAAGYAPMTRSIFMDYAPVRDLTLNLRVEQLTDWRTFDRVAELLRGVTLEFRLDRH